MTRRADDFAGLDLTSPANRIPAGMVYVAANARAYGHGQFELRNQLSGPISVDSSAPIVLDSSVQSLVRMNDTTPAGPPAGYVVISADADGNLFVNDTKVATGLSGNPVSLIPFRPNTSVQPWCYVGDNSENVTLTTKFALNGDPTTFNCFGPIKVRSDGLAYKTGIKEPASAPTVTTQNTTVTTTGNLKATTIPWTNVNGQNPSPFDYGQTNAADGTAPFIVDCANASTIVVTASGTATINGSPASPNSNGPAPGSTNPGGSVQTGGSPTPPVSVSVVVGVFTDGNGNAIAQGVAPLYVPNAVDVGGTLGSNITVPFGAQQFQIGINSTQNTFSSNSGSFSITVAVTTDALPPFTGILGQMSLYYWGDSPHSGPVGGYIWKNPDDPGGGTPRTIGNANGNTTGNSFIFDATFTAGIPGTPGTGNSSIPMAWFAMSPESAVIGSAPVFPSPLTTSDPTNTQYANFNFVLFGKIYIPAPGQYTFVLTNHDDCIWGIQNAVLISATPSGSGESGSVGLSQFGQTITVAQGYPLLPRENYTAADGGKYAKTTVVVFFAAAGIYGVEIDYDYWKDTGRILLLEGSSTAGGGATIIPPIVQNTRSSVSYAGKYRSSLTGAQSNPSPTTTPQTLPVLANTISLPYSPDPQVDKVDFYRQDSGLPNYTYVATGPNTNPPTAITDSLTDAAAANNEQMTFTDYEPVPSIDLPKAGVVDVSGGVITWVSGDQFNTRWLPGTIILIGSPTQLPYTFISRPTSATQVTIPGVPDGTNLAYNIAEPILANQPLPYMWGPTDNIPYIGACGDPLRPGTYYWCDAENPDSWSDTNQVDVTDPSETLVNGAMSGGLQVLFSNKRAWIVTPNFFNALATVTGTSGSTWSFQATAITRGLHIPRCLAVEGSGKIFFRVPDGIHVSVSGGPSASITDDSIYPLFSQEADDEGASAPQPITRNGITIYPPNDALPNRQKFSIVNSYLYYDFEDINGSPRTLVYDILREGWVWDIYAPPTTIHAANLGLSIQGVLAGCSDGSVRLMVSEGAVEAPVLTVATPAIGGAGYMTGFELTVEYSCEATATVNFLAVDVNNGSYPPGSITLASTAGQMTKFTTKVSPNKWKLLQANFVSTDPTLQVYLAGCVMSCKPWGSNGAYHPIPLFAPAGGEGPQS